MRIAASQPIAAPASEIFALSQDYTKRLSWDPFLREAILLGEGAAGVGTRSWCVTWFGMGMESEYVSYRPPHVVAVKMTKGPWVFAQFAASWNFRETGERSTDVQFLYSFRLRTLLRPFTPVAGWIFRYEMKRRLEALRRACEAA